MLIIIYHVVSSSEDFDLFYDVCAEPLEKHVGQFVIAVVVDVVGSEQAHGGFAIANLQLVRLELWFRALFLERFPFVYTVFKLPFDPR